MHFRIVFFLIRVGLGFVSVYIPKSTDGHLVRFSKIPMIFIGVRRC